MTTTALERRLGVLEQAKAAGAQIPLHIQRWLGADLTKDQNREADRQAETACSGPPFDQSTFAPEMRNWLIERGAEV
ncbi:hypothetical protein [Sphingomonas sp. Leaf17]|uniref:hypothetical protein n=1 Tax=Sphingomonas sp. Leaf17 TaxID=1735683 RepID=UPI000A4222BB|nr:hypothetical protein [Sphingomonas sp. Leaf17]